MFNNSHDDVIIIEGAGTIRHTGSADLNEPSYVHANSYPHRGSRNFFIYVTECRNDFAFTAKPLIFSTR